MAHYHSGLPPMDLEPFDPTPLWAATQSSARYVDRSHDAARTWLLRLAGVAGLLAAAVVAGVVLFG